MIFSLYKNAGIAAKTAAMKQKHLSKEQYSELVKMPSVAEVCSYLKENTIYGEVFGGVNERQLHRDQIEELLSKYLQDEFKKIYNFVTGDYRRFLEFLFTRYEIEQLKSVLRLIDSGEQVDITFKEGFFAKKSRIDIFMLYQCKTHKEVAEVVLNTPYHSILESYINRKTSIFQLEMALDAFYFKEAWSIKDKILKGEDKKIISDSLGREIDMLNLMWVYRCKRYYSLNSELIYTHIIPIHYKLSKDKLVELVESQSVEGFLSEAKKTAYASLFYKIDVQSVEHNYAYLVLNQLKMQRRKHPFSIASMVSYIHLMEIEIKNITSILEAIRYKIKPSESIYTI